MGLLDVPGRGVSVGRASFPGSRLQHALAERLGAAAQPLSLGLCAAPSRPGAAAGGWRGAGRVGGCGLIGTSVPQDAGRQRALLRTTLQPPDLPCKPYPELPADTSAGLGALSCIKIYIGLSGLAKLVFPGLCCMEFSPEPLWLW